MNSITYVGPDVHKATIRALLIKIAVRVEELRTRIKLSFSAHLSHEDALEMIAARICPQAP